MTYLNRTQDSRNRAIAIASVGAIHVAIGLAVVMGLTVSGVIRLENPKMTPIDFTVKDPPPPDPVPTETPTQTYTQPEVPERPVDLSSDTTIVVDTFDPLAPIVDVPVNIPIPNPTFTPPLPPKPTPTFTPSRAAPANDASRWITTDDYPGVPLRKHIEGVSGYRLVIGTNGRVNACDITRSSGNRQLDEATCKLITRRARFDPATDGSGAEVVGNFTGTVRWQIPD